MSGDLVIIFISAGAIVIGAYLWQRANHLVANGKTAKAIVYKNNYHPDKTGGTYYPVVRFLTEKQEWITQELNIGYSPARREGTKLEVIYDPEEPTTVEVNAPFQLIVLPRVLVAIGIVGLIFGALEYLQITHIISSLRNSN
jgi:uncharacterized membrane protein YidH (DUF202 family)